MKSVTAWEVWQVSASFLRTRPGSAAIFGGQVRPRNHTSEHFEGTIGGVRLTVGGGACNEWTSAPDSGAGQQNNVDTKSEVYIEPGASIKGKIIQNMYSMNYALECRRQSRVRPPIVFLNGGDSRGPGKGLRTDNWDDLHGGHGDAQPIMAMMCTVPWSAVASQRPCTAPWTAKDWQANVCVASIGCALCSPASTNCTANWPCGDFAPPFTQMALRPCLHSR
jgi:hypothetical protein